VQKVQTEMPIEKPNWGQDSATGRALDTGKLKTTWLGHACFLVEFPIREAGGPIAGGDSQQEKAQLQKRGLRVLFDPVFSDRCSPSQLVGPKRFTRESLLADMLLVLESWVLIAALAQRLRARWRISQNSMPLSSRYVVLY
jgi:hypothetical protein